MNLLTIVVGLLLSPAQAGTDSTTHGGETKVGYQFRMLHAGNQIGTASYERISTATERRTLLTIDVTDNGVTVVATFDKLFKRDGTPEKKSYHGVVTTQGSAQTFADAAVFTPKGVSYTVSKGPETSDPKVITAPAQATIGDASEMWFDGITPKVGDAVTCTSFNVQTGTWEPTTSTYVGDEELKIGTKTFKTHHMHVKSEKGEIEMFIDDKSDIVVMDQVGAVRLERAE